MEEDRFYYENHNSMSGNFRIIDKENNELVAVVPSEKIAIRICSMFNNAVKYRPGISPYEPNY